MRKFIALGVLAFGAYLIISLSRSVWDLWEKQEAIETARDRVDKIASENNKLKSRLEYVKSEEFLEKEAREKLKLVKPGETIVIIPQSVLMAATAAAVPTPVPPNWEQWMRLFFTTQ